MRRRATLRPDASVTLADTWTTLERSSVVTWQWLTRARVTPEPGGARLDQDGKTLRLRIQDNPTAVVEVAPVAGLLNPRINTPAPDLHRLVIRLATPALTTGTLVVHLIPEPTP